MSSITLCPQTLHPTRRPPQRPRLRTISAWIPIRGQSHLSPRQWQRKNKQQQHLLFHIAHLLRRVIQELLGMHFGAHQHGRIAMLLRSRKREAAPFHLCSRPRHFTTLLLLRMIAFIVLIAAILVVSSKTSINHLFHLRWLPLVS